MFNRLLLTGLNGLKDSSPEKLAGNVYSVLLSIAQLAGVAVLIFGAFQMALAFNEQDSDKKIKAFYVILASIVLITLKWLVNKIAPGVVS